MEFRDLDEASVDKNFHYVTQLMRRLGKINNIDDFITVFSLKIDLTQVKAFLNQKVNNMIEKANSAVNHYFDDKIN